jgi:hypothetical protein
MKQAPINLLFSLFAFSIAYSIALLTGLALIQQAVLIAFVIQWILFVPAFIFQTEMSKNTGPVNFFVLLNDSTILIIQ